MKTKNLPVVSFKASETVAGQFEAIVAVFGNVDRAGDRIIKGAFADSIKAWSAKNRPIPIIFSHRWDDLDAHIGESLETKEVDEGLYVKGQLDMDEPAAAKVWRLMKAGRLAEFSFAYDVVEEKRQNGANELLKLDILEVGPTLIGMNPATQLLDVKGAKEGRRNSTKDSENIQSMHDLIIELGATCAANDDTTKSKSAGIGKKYYIAGSYEDRQGRIYDAAQEKYGPDVYDYETGEYLFVSVRATFTDSAIVSVTKAGDGTQYWEVAYTVGDDGSITFGDDKEVKLETVVTAKALVVAGKPLPKSVSTFLMELDLFELD